MKAVSWSAYANTESTAKYEKHHAWLNLFLNLLTFVSHARTSMFLKYGMEWRYHDHDTHTNIESILRSWIVGLLWKEGGWKDESH